MANSCRVAADILKWSAMVRNRKEFGEKHEHTVKGESFLTTLDRIAKMDKLNNGSEGNAPHALLELASFVRHSVIAIVPAPLQLKPRESPGRRKQREVPRQ